MDAARLGRVFQEGGPFASVLVDVSRDTETANQQVDLRVRAAVGVELDNDGASARADQILIAAAARTGADVTALPKTAIGGTPIAALLRWDQS